MVTFLNDVTYHGHGFGACNTLSCTTVPLIIINYSWCRARSLELISKTPKKKKKKSFKRVCVRFTKSLCERATPTSANSTLQTRIAAPLPN